MAKIPYQNPGSTEVQSPLISGITDGLNKISGMINMETQTDTVNLQEVYVDATDRYRIYEAPQGQKNWLRSPEPIIRKNGNIINPTINFYTIDYVGGSITFAEDARQTSTDEFSAEVTFIIESDLKMPLKADLDPDTKKLISSQIPDTLATKEELKPLQDKLEMDKGYFTDAEQLKRTYPVGEVGWHAVVGTTDTVWIWDGDTGAWVNSGTSDINASKVPFTKTTEVDSTNVQDAIEKLGINKANKDLTNVENTTFKNKGNSAGLAYKDLTNITDLTFKQKGDAAGLATKDLSNIDNTIFKTKGNSAGLAYANLNNISNTDFKSKGYTSGLETGCLCNCTKTSSVFNISPVNAIYSDQKFKLLYFKAPADYVTGDTFNIAGVPVSFIVNSISSKSAIPNKVFKQYQVVSVLYDIASTNIYLVNPNSLFTDLSNVELRDFYNVGINSGLSIAPGVDYSFDSKTNTYTLTFDTALGYNLFDNVKTQYVPITFYNTNPITNATKFKAPDRNGSSIEYSFFIGNQLATSWSSFSLILGSTSLVLDIVNKRIYLPISSLFNMDYNQVAYGMQLPVGLRLKNTGNYGSRLRFGDGDYCYLAELADDQLTIHGRRLRLETNSANTSDGIVLTTSSAANTSIQTYTSGTGKLLYNNTEVAKVDLSNTTSTQFETKLINTSNFLNHKCMATKSGTVFALVVDPAVTLMTSQFAVSFVAPANFNAGDTFSLQFSTGTYSDFVPYLNGKIATKGFALNDVVTLNVNTNSKKVFFRSSAGGLELPADYSNGGIILPNAPEEIKKVTARGTGVCPILRPTINFNTTKTLMIGSSSGSSRLIISKKNPSGYVMVLYSYPTYPSLELHKVKGGLGFDTYKSISITNTSYQNNPVDISASNAYTFVLYNNSISVYNNIDLSFRTNFNVKHNYTKILASHISYNYVYGIYNRTVYLVNINDYSEIIIATNSVSNIENLIEDEYSSSLSFKVVGTNGATVYYTYLIENLMSKLNYGFYISDKILDVDHNIIYYQSSSDYSFGYTYFNPFKTIKRMVITSSSNSEIIAIKSANKGNLVFSLRKNGLIEYYGPIGTSNTIAKLGEYNLGAIPDNVDLRMTIDEQYGCLYVNYSNEITIIRYVNNSTSYALYD